MQRLRDLLTGIVSKILPETLMINSIFDRSKSKFTHRNSERPFDIAGKQQLAFAADLEQELRELERRFTSNFCALSFDQQNADATTTQGVSEPCTYDDFGLVEGLALDVDWM